MVEEKVQKHPEIKDWSVSFKKRVNCEFLGMKYELICICLRISSEQSVKSKDLTKEISEISEADSNQRKIFAKKLLETKTEIEKLCKVMQIMIDQEMLGGLKLPR